MVAVPDMFVEDADDPRIDGPYVGDERTVLLAMLTWQRQTLELKCGGLDAEQLARRALPPSSLSLLGLVRHLAEVERGWSRVRMAREPRPPHFRSREDPDGDFDGAVPDDDVVAEAWRVWRDEADFTDGFVRAAPSLDITCDEEWRGEMSLRWVLVHLIEEYARHNGHADLLREQIDGRVGQ